MTPLAPPGFLVVLSGPSGVGKTTFRKRLLAEDGALVYSVSATTRPRRDGEVDGRDYVFLSAETFAERTGRDEFAEWAVVHEHSYGTPRAPIESAMASGKTVLLDVDVQGGERLRRAYPDGVFIFLLPPSMDTLESRLRGRQTDADETVRGRLRKVPEEIAHVREYTYAVVNDDVERAYATIRAIVEAERHKVRRLLSGSMPEFLAGMQRE